MEDLQRNPFPPHLLLIPAVLLGTTALGSLLGGTTVGHETTTPQATEPSQPTPPCGDPAKVRYVDALNLLPLEGAESEGPIERMLVWNDRRCVEMRFPTGDTCLAECGPRITHEPQPLNARRP